MAVWKVQVAAGFRFLEELAATPSIHGQVWTVKMREHYSRNLMNLLRTPPVGCEHRAKRYISRLRKLIG